MSKTICKSGRVWNSTFVFLNQGVKTSGEVFCRDFHYQYTDSDKDKVEQFVNRKIQEENSMRRYWRWN